MGKVYQEIKPQIFASDKITPMKLLLTSNGIANKSLENALRVLIGNPFNKTHLAFIPTAANVEKGDKGWLIDDLSRCKNLGFASIDIVDISSIPEKIWGPRLDKADVFLFGGGNTFHLMYWLNKSGLADLLKRKFKDKIYVGISAGSMVTSKRILLSQSEKLYYEDLKGNQNEKGLGFVDFQIRPHLNNSYFPNVRKEILEKQAKEISEPIYAIDDETALIVVDNKVEVVGKGKYLIFNSH